VIPYARPTYLEIKARIEADLAAMPAVLRTPLSAAWARACNSQHGYLDWIDAQCSPLTCELERLYDWAMLYGVNRLSAFSATGSVIATGNPGSIILAGTLLRGANGLDYTVLAAVALVTGSTPVSVRCTLPGLLSNLIAGQQLVLVDPVPGCTNVMTVDVTGLSGGADEELLDDWRMRVADEWRTVVTLGPRAGKPDDYRFWAKSAHPSVTTALVHPHALGLGTVLVRPICNGLTSRLPTQAILDAIAVYLGKIAPATADWRVAKPQIHSVSVSINLLAGSDTAQNRAAISNALALLVLSTTSETALLIMAEIDAAIASVTTQYTRVSPTVDISVAPGEVLVINPVMWV
jgi:uncharacterized phage protein gp47/JayE